MRNEPGVSRQRVSKIAVPGPRQSALGDLAASQRWLLPLAIGLIALALDQLSKRWVVAALGPNPHERSITVGVGWLRLLYSQNTGVAFSLFEGMPTLFTITSLVITTGAIIAYVVYLPNRIAWVQVAMGLIVGGALGNIVDRLRLGYVVDFIAVGWWPVFNLADSAVTVGVLMLSGYLIFVGDEPAPAPRPLPRDDRLLSELLGHDLDEG